MSGAGEAAGDPRPLSAFRLLAQAAFGRFFVGNLISNIGNWFQDIALAILVFDLTGSATLVGFVAFVGYGTSLLLAPAGGQLADSRDRRSVLIIVHLAQFGLTAALTALLLVGSAELSLVFVFAGLIGAGRAITTPAAQAFLPALVHRKDLPTATALQSLTYNGARAVGPLVGAIVVTTAGVAVAFAANALSFLAMALLLFSIRPPYPPTRPTAPSRIRDGLGYLRARPPLILLLVSATVVGMSTDPVLTLGPSFAAFHGEPAAWAGYLVTSFGVGAVLAAPFTGPIRRRIGQVRTASIAVFVIASGLLVLALAPVPWLCLAGGALAGAAFLVAGTDLSTTLQELVDDRYRGRVMAVWSMGFLGSRPLAALLDGALADLWSPQAAVAVLAAVMIGSGVLIATGYRRLGGGTAFGTGSASL